MAQAAPVAQVGHRLVILRYDTRGSTAQDLLQVLDAQTTFSVTVRTAAADEDVWPLGEGSASVFAILVVPDSRHIGSIDRILAQYRASRWTAPLVLALDLSVEPERVLRWLQNGAWDFISPPFSAAAILPRLWRLDLPQPDEGPSSRRLEERMGALGILGHAPPFASQIYKIPMIARCSAGVLIQGETGTGKELVARAIHHLSPRSGQPFVAVNCAGIPDGLAENELWGHAKGAYTGASHRQQGLVAEANSGTLFLDDVDRLGLAVQAKLLRFLQEREYRVLGSPRLHRADVRIIASSNRSLEEETRSGRFRLDLYHRLNVVPITIPPLRERLEDIPLLTRHFLSRYSRELGIPAPEIPTRLMDLLLTYDWPGNVRELEHVIERAVVLNQGPMLDAANLMIPVEQGSEAALRFQEAKAAVIRRFERAYLERQLSRHAGNVSRAARASGKHRRAFFELLRKHEIQVEHFRQ